jgi:excisionase family DNA binding protein
MVLRYTRHRKVGALVAEHDELLTVDEVAERVKVNPETVRRWVRSGRLPAVKPAGGPYRIHSIDLDRLFGVSPKDEASPSPEISEGERREQDLENLDLASLLELNKSLSNEMLKVREEADQSRLDGLHEQLQAVSRALIRKGPWTETKASTKRRRIQQQSESGDVTAETG